MMAAVLTALITEVHQRCIAARMHPTVYPLTHPRSYSPQ